MVVSYNASAVKNYNAKGSLVHFENKNTFFFFEKRSILWMYNKSGVVLVNSETKKCF
jgi:hypothetical protein